MKNKLLRQELSKLSSDKVDNGPDVAGLILVRHGNIPAVRHEIDDDDLSKLIALDRKRFLDDPLNVIVEDPLQTLRVDVVCVA